ncbi:UNVERIFIED_CONTAM: hypothetical protein GTU68_001685 [Idotea baltica]|nr:hypothetical protein [Idotea baltica]
MSLEKTIMTRMKEAMKSKDQAALRTLRAIKNEILKAKTSEGFSGEVSEDDEQKILIKMAKQRRDSLAIFNEQGRADLAETEQEELTVITSFLPEQLSEEDIRAKVKEIVAETGASSMKDMGRVMGMASKAMAGAADGKVISGIVKELLG